MKKIILNVLIGTLLMLLLGIVYSYSIFRLEIEEVYSVSTLSSGMPYMLVLFFYALFMMIGGILYSRFNTSLIAFIGAGFIVSGFLLSSIASSIFMLSITYGVIVGTGVGILYGLPLRIVAQQNHQKIGLLTGITLLGFGLSPLVFAPVIHNLIINKSLSFTFLTLGIVFFIGLFPLVYYLSNQESAIKLKKKLSYPILRNRQFYVIYILFFIGTFIGLTFIGLTGTIGENLIQLNTTKIAFLIGMFAIFNGIGRPIFGYINDKIGFKYSALLSFSSLIFATVLHYLFQNYAIYIFSFIIFYLNFGGWLSLAPSATRKIFGSEDYSKNYGLMFTAYGVGAIVGTSVSGILIETVSLESIFLLMAGLSVIGGFIILKFFEYPKKK
jgi:MFS family permease